MKKRIWLAFLVLLAVVIVGGRESRFFQQHDSVEVVETRPVITPQPKLPAVNQALQVSADQLLTHIQKLNFQRYTAKERSLTRIYIINELRKLGWKPQLEKFPGGVNIFTERQGTDTTAQAILVAAHYDTVAESPGSDDNASGVAVLLELARIFHSLPTPQNLQLAFFDQEEAGLVGSKAFVKAEKRLQNLQGVIVMDMIGYACYTSGCQQYPQGLPVTPPSDKGDFLVAIGDTEHLPLLTAFQKSQPQNLPEVLTLPIPLKGLLTPDTLRSDHAPFWYQGVGAVLVTDTANLRTPHYHQPTDTPQNIERSFFLGSAQIVVNAINNLLNQPAIPTTN
ncbi:MAG TPA: M28 family peptidase [Trichormus sp. M33_DOE_039]|nr:M28 family peptidase [Trichormus sp. M33_DOE_039]